MLKRFVLTVFTVFLALVLVGAPAMAQDSSQATTDEVYDIILKAVNVLGTLGEEGLAAFNDPKGEFSYKDTYVMVINCDTMKIVAHPNPKLVGLDVAEGMDKNPDPAKQINPNVAVCEVKKNPNGGWVEYYWEKLGETTPSRKISFALGVPETPWVLVAGIYNDTISVQELNAKIP